MGFSVYIVYLSLHYVRPRCALVGKTERPVRISSPRSLWFSFLFLFFWLTSVICGFGGVR